MAQPAKVRAESTRIETLDRAWVACVACGRSIRSFGGRYRDFLLQPASVFGVASLLLLIAAAIQSPAGIVSSGSPQDAGTPLYLAAALTGSLYIWWSALQGIRARDFTADIPVSIATAAAIGIGQYSAAAVVAVLLLLGGMLENFVAARAGRAPSKRWLRCSLIG